MIEFTDAPTKTVTMSSEVYNSIDTMLDFVLGWSWRSLFDHEIYYRRNESGEPGDKELADKLEAAAKCYEQWRSGKQEHRPA
jgi:hypothetical protein